MDNHSDKCNVFLYFPLSAGFGYNDGKKEKTMSFGEYRESSYEREERDRKFQLKLSQIEESYKAAPQKPVPQVGNLNGRQVTIVNSYVCKNPEDNHSAKCNAFLPV